MKLLIAGSRTISLDAEKMACLVDFLRLDESNLEIVSGGAKGIDTSAEEFAKIFNLPFKLFPADWDNLGKRAGPVRNEQMAKYSDMLLLIWDGESRGSKSMKELMIKEGKPIVEIILK